MTSSGYWELSTRRLEDDVILVLPISYAKQLAFFESVLQRKQEREEETKADCCEPDSKDQ
jgi:hypothetical protein